MGRFIQQDPIGDGMNWYAYVENAPLLWVDPEGLRRRGLLSRIGKAIERALTWSVRAALDVIMNAVWPAGSKLGSNLSPNKVNPGLEDIYATLGRGEGFDAREAAKQCLVVPAVAALSQPMGEWLAARGLPIPTGAKRAGRGFAARAMRVGDLIYTPHQHPG